MFQLRSDIGVQAGMIFSVPVVLPESCSTAGPWTSSDGAIPSSSAFSFSLISWSCRSSICINGLSGAPPTVTSCRIAGNVVAAPGWRLEVVADS